MRSRGEKIGFIIGRLCYTAFLLWTVQRWGPNFAIGMLLLDTFELQYDWWKANK